MLHALNSLIQIIWFRGGFRFLNIFCCLFLSGENISVAKWFWRPWSNFFRAVDQSVISFMHKSNNFLFLIFYKSFGIHQPFLKQFSVLFFEAEIIQTNKIPRVMLFTSKKLNLMCNKKLKTPRSETNKWVFRFRSYLETYAIKILFHSRANINENSASVDFAPVFQQSSKGARKLAIWRRIKI